LEEGSVDDVSVALRKEKIFWHRLRSLLKMRIMVLREK
jgi:hypothetical protein